MKYYNAATTKAPGHLLLNVEEVSEDDHFYKLYKAQIRRNKLTSRAKAEAHDVTGSVAWTEKGKMYKASSTGSFEWNPLNPGEIGYSSGINWGTAYFCSLEEAENWSRELSGRRDKPLYDALGDVWSVHYHY